MTSWAPFERTDPTVGATDTIDGLFVGSHRLVVDAAGSTVDIECRTIDGTTVTTTDTATLTLPTGLGLGPVFNTAGPLDDTRFIITARATGQVAFLIGEVAAGAMTFGSWQAASIPAAANLQELRAVSSTQVAGVMTSTAETWWLSVTVSGLTVTTSTVTSVATWTGGGIRYRYAGLVAVNGFVVADRNDSRSGSTAPDGLVTVNPDTGAEIDAWPWPNATEYEYADVNSRAANGSDKVLLGMEYLPDQSGDYWIHHNRIRVATVSGTGALTVGAPVTAQAPPYLSTDYQPFWNNISHLGGDLFIGSVYADIDADQNEKIRLLVLSTAGTSPSVVAEVAQPDDPDLAPDSMYYAYGISATAFWADYDNGIVKDYLYTAAPGGAPPLRQYPRSDALAGSAKRMWPPSRSIQRSLRQGPGAYL